MGALYLAVCLSSSLLVQTGKEIVDDHFAFDPRVRAMLALAVILALVSCAMISGWIRHNSAGEARRLLKMAIRKLPFSGAPLHFATCTFVVTLLVAVLSHFGEHDQLGDALVAFFTAFVIALISAILCYLLLRALPEVVALIVVFLFGAQGDAPRARFIEPDISARHLSQSWPPPLLSRPPPLQL